MKLFNELKARRLNGPKLTVVTCYDATFARLLLDSPVDSILVGDSVSMVIHGAPNTLSATTEMMVAHTKAVSSVIKDTKWIMTDLPFLATRKGLQAAMETVQAVMTAGAHAVKVEGVQGHEEILRQIVQSGVPLVGHLGLTPQFQMQFGGFKVQGKEKEAADSIFNDAKKLEQIGASALVLECVPSELAARIQDALSIPVIGIGAGDKVAGQVLVLHDLLGLAPGFKPKFLRTFAPGAEMVSQAMKQYCAAVQSGEFPKPEESYS